MAVFAEKNHSNAEWKERKNNGLAYKSDALALPKNITTFHHQIFITARWLSARFGIGHDLMRRVVDDIEFSTAAIMYRDGQDVWIGGDAFIEIYQHPLVDDRFDEAARLSVLQLLGSFREVAP
ncbi:hypothetical protein VSS37_03870 [Candidatus Thiothrix sp. Deng01]|uniref:Uncharacterized protein n=1 Tax=Candidatus Thiothrix phosphatis TaxID=3112415 RepID=A0ABU6CTH5_9GAMM|nr:hypothetical protein [Candidatus Thiothrix sp. Deng01]MEB4590109.1 hypothetical protein [Candidatus Thiothrix sp. Deng01]